jgi:hypothetical protein
MDLQRHQTKSAASQRYGMRPAISEQTADQSCSRVRGAAASAGAPATAAGAIGAVGAIGVVTRPRRGPSAASRARCRDAAARTRPASASRSPAPFGNISAASTSGPAGSLRKAARSGAASSRTRSRKMRTGGPSGIGSPS